MKDTTNKIIYISSAVVFLGLVAGAFYIGLGKEEGVSENDANISRALAYAEPITVAAENATLSSAVEDLEEAVDEESLAEEPLAEEPLAEESLEDRITANTKIIYEYYYEDNEEVVKYEEAPKYFHLDKTEEMFKELYTEWDIISFSSNEVVLRNVVEASKSRPYTVGVYDGNVAVFYADVEEGANALKEVTGTPITSLSQAEQTKLLNGIPISDEDALIKILEEYSS